MHKRYFTLEEAHSTIPQVKRQVKQLQKIKRALDLLSSIEVEYTEPWREDLPEVNIVKMNMEFHRLSYEFYASLSVLHDLGCLLKDIDQGIIDFLSVHEGRDIFLCWQMGENGISFWHEFDTGFENRKSIELLKQG